MEILYIGLSLFIGGGTVYGLMANSEEKARRALEARVAELQRRNRRQDQEARKEQEEANKNLWTQHRALERQASRLAADNGVLKSDLDEVRGRLGTIISERDAAEYLLVRLKGMLDGFSQSDRTLSEEAA